MSMSNLELACQVFWGETTDPEESFLTSSDNPETKVLMSERFHKMSAEAKLLANTIMDLPDEMFKVSGQILPYEITSWMKRKFGWTPRMVEKYKREIAKVYGVTT